MHSDNYVVVIGAANIDIQGFSFQKLVLEDSNPGKIKISSGGVGRNIAENLARLGVKVKLMTVLGDDPYSKSIIKECSELSIDVSHSLIMDNSSSPIYLSILENNGDMKLAMCDNEILEAMTIDFIEDNHDVINNSEIILLDTNLPIHILKHIAHKYKHKQLYIDTVSTQKALKIKDFLGCFTTIKLNLLEAKALSGILIEDFGDLNKFLDYFVKCGVTNVFITLGKDGVYYGDANYENRKKTPEVKVVNATGAGDAFMAALIYSSLYKMDMDSSAVFAMGASILALYHEKTINPEMSVKNINNLIEEMKIC